MPVHAFVCNADNPTDQIYRLSSPFGDAVAFLLDFHGPWLEMRRSEVELAKAKQILTPETVEELLGEIAKREQAEASQAAAA